jgi:hypothetical protein
LHGRNEIGQRHAHNFAGPFRGSALKISLRSLTKPAPGLVLLETD